MNNESDLLIQKLPHHAPGRMAA
uniref:Uncharacterized protein n=1 Tax=Arundo donax TaxID=35708 RepID=A0A0A9B2Q1_ARUDO